VSDEEKTNLVVDRHAGLPHAPGRFGHQLTAFTPRIGTMNRLVQVLVTISSKTRPPMEKEDENDDEDQRAVPGELYR
jgi:hypothetical protein